MTEPNSLSVLVVEDEYLLLEAISKKLQLKGFSVISTSSGKQALDYLVNFNKLPDVIWLDFRLSDMDGIEFMHEMQKHKELAKVPVVVISNSASAENVKTMLSLGAKEYLLKADYTLDELVNVIQKFKGKNK